MSSVITIDGPTSSGKTSVGHLFSQKIGYQFIDTGAIYRIGCLVALRDKVDINSEEAVAKIFEDLNVSFKSLNGNSKVYLKGKNVTNILHTSEITNIVPIVAAYPQVRANAKKIQHKLGNVQDTVMAGRDIGSEIFPNSRLKFFITADVKVRAKRRYDQLERKEPNMNFDEVLEGMVKRDDYDSKREASPMRVSQDAVVIDTTHLTTEQSVHKMMEEYHKRFG